MGAFRFEREPPVPNSNKNVIEFDSSAERAIGRAYGLDPATVELRERERVGGQINYDVWASEYTPEGQPQRELMRRGTLKILTRAECRRIQDDQIPFGTRRFI